MQEPLMPASRYCGRFAPSPTGELHFGSLVAALGSYLDAKAGNGRWLLRIEDIDPLRCVPGAADDIVRTLEHYGFEWDGPIIRQSDNSSQQRYQDALEKLTLSGLTYPCGCSRREIADSSLQGVEGPVYPGTCRHGLASGKAPRSVRIRTSSHPIGFNDTVQGTVEQCLETEVGDFVLKRADGPFSYQLAVVVDDAYQGVTDVVRGIDLLVSTPRQIYLQQCLGLPALRYAHLPLAVNQYGQKLSKQNQARPLTQDDGSAGLYKALTFLGQTPPVDSRHWTAAELMLWAIANWDVTRVPHRISIIAEEVATSPPNA